MESVANKYLQFGISIMLEALRDDPRAKIVWPNQGQGYLESMERLMHLYVPRLRDYNVRPVAFH